jgi:hypothetical protein
MPASQPRSRPDHERVLGIGYGPVGRDGDHCGARLSAPAAVSAKHRRLLTAEQKRELIAKLLLKAKPEFSNLQIAKTGTAFKASRRFRIRDQPTRQEYELSVPLIRLARKRYLAPPALGVRARTALLRAKSHSSRRT